MFTLFTFVKQLTVGHNFRDEVHDCYFTNTVESELLSCIMHCVDNDNFDY